MLGLLLQAAEQAEAAVASVPEVVQSGGFPAAELVAGLGAALAVLGAGWSISRIGVSANEGIARQPEAAADIRGGSLILSALIEGIALFAVLVTLLLATK